MTGPSNTDILLKDSIYAAIGLSAPVLEHDLDFAAFLEKTLVPEVQNEQAGYNILRRRIAIVLGQWMLVKQGLNRPLVYQIFQFLMDSSSPLNDEVVRVTAGRQLRNVIDPFEFTAEPFMPFAEPIIGRLLALIQEVELSETKLALLNTLSVMVVRMEGQVRDVRPVVPQKLRTRRSIHSLTKYYLSSLLSGLKQVICTSTSKPSSESCPSWSHQVVQLRPSFTLSSSLSLSHPYSCNHLHVPISSTMLSISGLPLWPRVLRHHRRFLALRFTFFPSTRRVVNLFELPWP